MLTHFNMYFVFNVLKLNVYLYISSSADTKDNKKLPQRGIHGKDRATGKLKNKYSSYVDTYYYFRFSCTFIFNLF